MSQTSYIGFTFITDIYYKPWPAASPTPYPCCYHLTHRGQLHTPGPGRIRSQGLIWELVQVNAVRLEGAAAIPPHEEPASNLAMRGQKDRRPSPSSPVAPGTRGTQGQHVMLGRLYTAQKHHHIYPGTSRVTQTSVDVIFITIISQQMAVKCLKWYLSLNSHKVCLGQQWPWESPFLL